MNMVKNITLPQEKQLRNQNKILEEVRKGVRDMASSQKQEIMKKISGLMEDTKKHKQANAKRKQEKSYEKTSSVWDNLI